MPHRPFLFFPIVRIYAHCSLSFKAQVHKSPCRQLLACAVRTFSFGQGSDGSDSSSLPFARKFALFRPLNSLGEESFFSLMILVCSLSLCCSLQSAISALCIFLSRYSIVLFNAFFPCLFDYLSFCSSRLWPPLGCAV